MTGSSDQLERRCWNENHVPAEAGPPGPRLSSPGERERKAVIAKRVGGVNLCSVSNSLSHITLSIKWEVHFSKELCPLVFIVLNMFPCIVAYVSCGYTTLAPIHIHLVFQHSCRMDFNIVISEFELQLCYYVHFPINTQENSMNPFTTGYELNSAVLC